MKPTHIEHIGIAVANLSEAIRYYESVLNLECYAIEEVKDQKVRTAFFLHNNCTITTPLLVFTQMIVAQAGLVI